MELMSSLFVKTDVSFVKLYSNLIFVGNGYYLCIYCAKENKCKKQMYVFDQYIFGIDIYGDKMLVYGGKYLKIFTFELSLFNFEETASRTCSDWILHAKFLNNSNYIATVWMHNIVSLLDASLDNVESKECIERCISYCAHFVNDNWNDLIVLSGTVFSQILIWWPAKSPSKLCPVTHRLIGHKGVIFSIDYNPMLNLICTTSDDRTARTWRIRSDTLKNELSQNPISIELKDTLVGHTARVFKCKLQKDSIITAGEDGVINIWNIDGTLRRKIEVHQGGPIWSLDYCQETNKIISGGGDSGVFLLKSHSSVLKSQLENKTEDPRRILILSSDNLIYLTENGGLYLYKRKSETSINICTHSDLKSYGLVEKSYCGKLIALAGYRGNIHLYQVLPEGLEYMYSCQIKSKERIFSIHWLSCFALLTCGKDGILILWLIGKSTMYPSHFWQLPASKERWSTAACFCGLGNVVVGDRRGAIYFYGINSSQPIQIIKKAHNYLGVSALYYRSGKIVSLGRNSTINEYQIDYEHQRLTPISSHKVPFTWLAGLHEGRACNAECLIGFSGTNFIVYDHMTRRILFEVECGGGHRSWDVHTANNLIFAYVKNKHVHLVECDLADLRGSTVIKGYHLNEINALRIIKTGDSTSQRRFFVSGGEDTVLRLCSKNFADNLSDFNHLCALKSHLSSIRALAIVEVGQSRNLMISGGGRSQIILWELSMGKVGDETVVNCSEMYNHYEKSSDKDESETRVMDMTTTIVDGTVFLLAAYSDGAVRTFKVNTDRQLIQINQTQLYKCRCIFKICILSLAQRNILVTTASDGCIVFTDITNVFLIPKFSDTILLNSTKAHQSGINSFDYWSSIDDGTLITLTGGDDTAVVLNAFDIQGDTDTKITFSSSFCDESYHQAQVTGAYITDKYFLTASIDQKVLLFNWNFENEFTVQCIRAYNSSICDIQGMECVLSRDYVQVLVYGRGCEIINCKIIKDGPNR